MKKYLVIFLLVSMGAIAMEKEKGAERESLLADDQLPKECDEVVINFESKDMAAIAYLIGSQQQLNTLDEDLHKQITKQFPCLGIFLKLYDEIDYLVDSCEHLPDTSSIVCCLDNKESSKSFGRLAKINKWKIEYNVQSDENNKERVEECLRALLRQTEEASQMDDFIEEDDSDSDQEDISPHRITKKQKRFDCCIAL